MDQVIKYFRIRYSKYGRIRIRFSKYGRIRVSQYGWNLIRLSQYDRIRVQNIAGSGLKKSRICIRLYDKVGSGFKIRSDPDSVFEIWSGPYPV
mgnify:CR=1 FL=1